MISGIYGQGYHWQVPFVKCDSRLCTEDNQDAYTLCEYHALGIAPLLETDEIGKQQANEFRNYIYERYPQLLRISNGNDNQDDNDNEGSRNMPFNFDFIQMFNSDKDIEKYVSSNNYKPKLALAVIFDGISDYPTINYNYKIRLNSTNFNSPEDEARPAIPTTPPTNIKLDTYAVNDDSTSCGLLDGTSFLGPYQNSCTGQYIYNGALIIQRLVNDFIIHTTQQEQQQQGAANDEDSAYYYVSEHGVQYAPFPTKEYEENGFYAAIGCK